MNFEIKERIEKLSKGEVPEGYISNELGIYPAKWNKTSFGKLFEFCGGLSASRSELSNEGIPYLHYGDIHTSNKTYISIALETDSLPKLNIDNNMIKKGSLLGDGDIVFADASEDYQGIGKSVVIYNPDCKKFISGLHTIIGKSASNELSREYKRYFISNSHIRKQIMFYATGISVLGISKSNLAKVVTFYPPIKEQVKISIILSTWDKAIELKEEIIEEKKKQKTGLMQILLTGKVRLPGFDGEWKEEKIGDIAKQSTNKNSDNKISKVLSCTKYNGLGCDVRINYGQVK
jgi:type I restriction enzyme S subunit